MHCKLRYAFDHMKKYYIMNIIILHHAHAQLSKITKYNSRSNFIGKKLNIKIIMNTIDL